MAFRFDVDSVFAFPEPVMQEFKSLGRVSHDSQLISENGLCGSIYSFKSLFKDPPTLITIEAIRPKDHYKQRSGIATEFLFQVS